MDRYDTAMAAEFYVLSMFYRLGVKANLTLGNQKAVDITVMPPNGDVLTIDVKGIRDTSSWPINDRVSRRSHFYVFVSFLGRITETDLVPEVYVVPSTSIRRVKYTNKTSGRKFVPLRQLRARSQRYRSRWDILW